MPSEVDAKTILQLNEAKIAEDEADVERERLRVEAEELAKTIRRLLYILLFAGFYLVLTLAVDDWKLVRADAEIAWAIAGQAAGVDVELSTFLTFAPLVLIAFLFYFHLFVGQLAVLQRLGTRAPETFAFTMRRPVAIIASDLLLYAFVPAVLAWFTWKTLFRSEALFLAITTAMTALACSALYYSRAKAQRDRVRQHAGLVALGVVSMLIVAHGAVLSWKGREPFLEWRRIDLVRAPLGPSDGVAADLRGLDLRYADARHAVLDDADLRYALLDRADLTDARLVGADLQEASLAGTKLIGADLTRADFSQATLISAILTQIKGESTIFNDAILNNADLRKAVLPAANFDRAKLTDAIFDLAELTNTRFGGADLSGAQLEDAAIVGSLFTNATLFDANFRYVDMFESNHFTGAKFCRTAVPPEGKLRNDHCSDAAAGLAARER